MVGPSVAAFLIDIQGRGDAVGLEGVVILYAVAYGNHVVVGVGHYECRRSVGRNVLLVAVFVNVLLVDVVPAHQVDDGSFV